MSVLRVVGVQGKFYGEEVVVQKLEVVVEDKEEDSLLQTVLKEEAEVLLQEVLKEGVYDLTLA